MISEGRVVGAAKRCSICIKVLGASEGRQRHQQAGPANTKKELTVSTRSSLRVQAPLSHN